jgi:hypothetical protein
MLRAKSLHPSRRYTGATGTSTVFVHCTSEKKWKQISKGLTDPHWARVVGYGPFSLCVNHREGLCPISGEINRLMMKQRPLGLIHRVIKSLDFNNLLILSQWKLCLIHFTRCFTVCGVAMAIKMEHNY